LGTIHEETRDFTGDYWRVGPLVSVAAKLLKLSTDRATSTAKKFEKQYLRPLQRHVTIHPKIAATWISLGNQVTVPFPGLRTKTTDSEADVQPLKVNETGNQISYPPNAVYPSQNERAGVVLVMNPTTICHSSVPLDRLDASITTRPCSSAVSQDSPEWIPKYKALLQEKEIRSNNMAILLKNTLFWGGVDVP